MNTKPRRRRRRHRGSKRLGKSMQFIARQALREYYRIPRYRTEAAHAERIRLFIRFAKEHGIGRWEGVDAAVVESYAGHLGDLLEEGDIAHKTAIDRVSTVNVVLRAIRGDELLTISPSGYLGKRKNVRVEPPLGLASEQVARLAAHLVDIGHARVATVAELARTFGHRFREAALCPVHEALAQARRHGAIDIRRGTKGGRGNDVERWVIVDGSGHEILERACQAAKSGTNVIPSDWDYARFYRHAHRVYPEHALAFGLSPKFHELRAAYACARYEALTGYPAPCIVGRRQAPREVHQRAAEQLARELGHNRVDVLAGYYGTSR